MSKRILRPGTTRDGDVFLWVEVGFCGTVNEGKLRLSISGVVGPKPNGDARGSCGQCVEALDELTALAPGWTPDMVARLRDVWKRWHLNDMRAGCEHQRDWPTTEPIEVVSYGLTTEAMRLRDTTRARLADAALRGETVELDARARALAGLADWYQYRFAPPDADSPLSGCYEVRKRETKMAGWVLESEHPRGLLSKACPTCGYRYGSAWLYEAVPEDVLSFLAGLPAADQALPTRWLRSA